MLKLDCLSERDYTLDDAGNASLQRFKWGVYVSYASHYYHLHSYHIRGRILASSNQIPTVIPMWLTGFDKIMPEGRSFPFKYFPKPGAHLTVTIGKPIPASDFRNLVDRMRKETSSSSDLEARLRVELTSMVHDAVQDLGRSVSGPSLGV